MAKVKPARKNKMTPRFEGIICACGCGESFIATVTTFPPKYKNNTHKIRAHRKRVKDRQAAGAADPAGSPADRRDPASAPIARSDDEISPAAAPSPEVTIMAGRYSTLYSGITLREMWDRMEQDRRAFWDRMEQDRRASRERMALLMRRA